jgi:hypothetical protein
LLPPPYRPSLEAEIAAQKEAVMNEIVATLLLTALRVVLPFLVLMGIGTYVERRRRPEL